MTNVEGLAVVLRKEEAGYAKLLKMADEKRRIIIDKDLEKLEKSSLEEVGS